jgi:hypothetical protein
MNMTTPCISPTNTTEGAALAYQGFVRTSEAKRGRNATAPLFFPTQKTRRLWLPAQPSAPEPNRDLTS